MYIIFQVLRFAQNLQRCARLSLFCRLSFCAPEPRDIALHIVCCIETLYVSLRDATNKMFFFSQKPIYNQSTIGEKRLFLREQKQTACVHSRALAPMYSRPKQAAFVHQLSSFALCAKLAGFADSAYFVEQAQSQTQETCNGCTTFHHLDFCKIFIFLRKRHKKNKTQ